MNEKKIEITREDFIEASVMVTADDEKTRKLIEENPLLILVFGMLAAKTWEKLVEIKEEDQAENKQQEEGNGNI